jgi:hypothetical protein
LDIDPNRTRKDILIMEEPQRIVDHDAKALLNMRASGATQLFFGLPARHQSC